MKKCHYHFYTEDAKGTRKYVHLGAYKQPERTAQWKSLMEQLNEDEVHLIGYELWNHKQKFN
jgi:hypothetical protein